MQSAKKCHSDDKKNKPCWTKLEKRQTIKTVVCMVHKSKKRRENQFLSRKSRYQAQTCNSHRTFSISHWISIAFCHRLTNNSNNISTHTHTKTSISINEKRKRGGEKAPSLNKYFHSQSANIRKLLLNSGSRELATEMNVDRCGEKIALTHWVPGLLPGQWYLLFVLGRK